MKLWTKRHRELNAARTRAVCRLHAVLCDLIPGGVRRRISAPMAVRLLENFEPEGAIAQARYELACDHVIDLLRVDDQIRQTNKHIAAAVKASKHHHHQGLRGRTLRGGHRQRRGRRHLPVHEPRPLRRLQRHRPNRSVLRSPQDLPTVAAKATGGSTTPSTWPP